MKNFTEINRALAAENTINSYALHVAGYIQKRRPELCWQACMYMAWRVAHCKHALREGTVAFSFIKLNGQIREAVGTTNLDLIPVEHHPSSGARSKNSEFATVAFYDLEKAEWRSFRTDFFIDMKS